MANEYQKMVKEQTEIDMSGSLGAPRPPLMTDSTATNSAGLNAIPSFDPREGLERRQDQQQQQQSEGGGTPLVELFMGEEPQADRGEAQYDRERQAAEFQEMQSAMRRNMYPADVRPYEKASREVETDPAESANRRLAATIFLVAIVLFAPPVQEWLSQILPSAFLFWDEWPRVALRAGLIALGVYAFRRFMPVGRRVC
jgi:hypothetical protein